MHISSSHCMVVPRAQAVLRRLQSMLSRGPKTIVEQMKAEPLKADPLTCGIIEVHWCWIMTAQPSTGTA